MVKFPATLSFTYATLESKISRVFLKTSADFWKEVVCQRLLIDGVSGTHSSSSLQSDIPSIGRL